MNRSFDIVCVNICGEDVVHVVGLGRLKVAVRLQLRMS